MLRVAGAGLSDFQVSLALFGPAYRNRTHIHRVEADGIIHYTNARKSYLTALALAMITSSALPFTITFVYVSVNPLA